ncbi:MAG: 50S ribosomal protein L23 [Deltaproteobacteria bacterium]|nr:50S ribosomal protein L23 [Deltaproteobacteria bacterium]
MVELRDVVLRPLITEKSARARANENTYVFEVGLDANKHQIKDAIERLFGVRVTGVRTVRVRGKVKRFGRWYGKRSNWKKAYVQLAEGNSIDFRDGT